MSPENAMRAGSSPARRPGLRVFQARGPEHCRQIFKALKRQGFDAVTDEMFLPTVAPGICVQQRDVHDPKIIYSVYMVSAWVGAVLWEFPGIGRQISGEGWTWLRARRAHIVTVARASRAEGAAFIRSLIDVVPYRAPWGRLG